MIIVNVHEAKAKISHFLDLVQKGQKVIISKRNIPIAELRPVNDAVSQRKLGQSEEKFEISDSFFKPLPEEILNGFTNPK